LRYTVAIGRGAGRVHQECRAAGRARRRSGVHWG